jgi:hypothetical protein
MNDLSVYGSGKEKMGDIAYRNAEMFSSYLERKLCICMAVGLLGHIAYSDEIIVQ